MKRRLATVLTGALALVAAAVPIPTLAQSTGTLVFDVKAYVSDVKIKPKVEKQLRHAGITWGIQNDVLVISFVNQKFVKAELSYLTRYGERRVLQLEPGEYKLTCIGFVPKGMSGDVDKVLSKSAFFNESVLKFRVQTGKTTVLEVLPVFQKHSTFLVKMFIPDLRTKVVEDGVVKAEAVVNEKTASSVPWDDYAGPLKF